MLGFIRGGGGPCFSLKQLWTPCFSHYAAPREVGRFIVERLGMFGFWGDEIADVPVAVLNAEPRLSWVVNNGDRWAGQASFEKLPLSNVTIGATVRAAASRKEIRIGRSQARSAA